MTLARFLLDCLLGAALVELLHWGTRRWRAGAPRRHARALARKAARARSRASRHASLRW